MKLCYNWQEGFHISPDRKNGKSRNEEVCWSRHSSQTHHSKEEAVQQHRWCIECGSQFRKESKAVPARQERPFAQSGMIDETFDPDEGVACEAVWYDYMKLPELGQGPGHRYENKCRVTSINIDGSVLIGSDAALMDDGNGVHRSGPVDGILGIFIVLDREPSDQRKPTFQDVFGEVTGNHGSKVDLHVRNDMLGRFRVLMREKIIVKGCNDGSRISIDRYIAFFGKNKFVTKFKDYGNLTDGRYSNVKENTLMLYIVWESLCGYPVAVNINSRMMYDH